MITPNPQTPAKKAAAKKAPAKKAAAKKKDDVSLVTASTETPLATTSTEAAHASLLGDIGVGLEEVSGRDLIVPRLYVMQSMSPWAQKSNEAYIEGCEEGNILNNVSEVAMCGEKGIEILPFYRTYKVIEKEMGKKGDKFVADRGNSPELLTGKHSFKNGEGKIVSRENDSNCFVETYEFGVLVINEDGSSYPALLSTTKSQLREARRWQTMMNEYRLSDSSGKLHKAPIWARTWRFTTSPVTHEDNTWMGWNLDVDRNVIDIKGATEILERCREMKEVMDEGSYEPKNDDAFNNGGAEEASSGKEEEDESNPM